MNSDIVIPGTICSTCLTQGRTMYQFPAKYTIPFSMYKDFVKAATDKICWECRHFILKMAAFRLKVLTAQSKLNRLYSKQPVALQSLSRLSVSRGIYLEIQHEPDLEYPDPLSVKVEVHIKAEDIDDESQPNDDNDMATELEETQELSFTEHYQVFQHKVHDKATASKETQELSLKEQYQVFQHKVHDKATASKETQELSLEEQYQGYQNKKTDERRELSSKEKFQVYQHKVSMTPKPIQATNVTQNSGNLANATLMSLLTRKKPPVFPPLPNMLPKNRTSTEIKQEPEINIEHPPEGTETNSRPDFTEQTLTEEEMRRWWEKKSQNKFYLNSAPVLRCDKCLEPFFTRRTYLGHEKMHTEMYGQLSCDICQLRFHTENLLAAHRETHYKLLKCGHCDHTWDNPNSMRRHCNLEHQLSCVTVWTCRICPRELSTYGQYLSHLKVHGSRPCPVCGKLVRGVSLKGHLSTHESITMKRYECADCGKKYRTKSALTTHIHSEDTSKASDPAPYCAPCQKQFRNLMSYQKHMKFASAHVLPDVLRHKCDTCSKAFALAAHLRKHVEAKHSDARNYPCRLCPARFRSASTRKRHRLARHEGYVAPKDKMCDHCGKAFETKAILATHINTHTGARPFVCKICGADFGHKSALYLHGRYKHKIPKKNELKT